MVSQIKRLSIKILKIRLSWKVSLNSDGQQILPMSCCFSFAFRVQCSSVLFKTELNEKKVYQVIYKVFLMSVCDIDVK